MTVAVIELASNSVSSLVARSTGEDDLDVIAEESTSVGIRDSLRATGTIVGDALDGALAAVVNHQALATANGAGHVIVVAHKAIRDAGNREAVLTALREATGLDVAVVSGSVVATLAFIGATSGPATRGDLAVLDVGPGSLEIIIGPRRHIAWLTSVPLGGAWLRDRYLCSNPPAADEIATTSAFLNTYIGQMAIPAIPETLIATGSIAKILVRLERRDATPTAARAQLTRAGLQGYWERIADRSTEAVAGEFDLSPARARVLPAGVLTMLAVMDHVNVDAVGLTSRGLPHGVLLAYARHGDSWLTHPDVAADPSRIAPAPPLPV